MKVLVMPFRKRFQGSLHPVNRVKHVFDEQGGLTAGTQLSTSIIKTVDAPVRANTNEVETASKVNGIYLRVEVNATTSAALANVYMSVQKIPGAAIATVAPNAVGANNDKKWVIHQEMVMLQQQDGSNPRTLFNGVIVIPRGYRRNGPDDIMNVVILAPGVAINYCIQCHYKEFR